MRRTTPWFSILERRGRGERSLQKSGRVQTFVKTTFGAKRNGFNFLILSARERHTALSSARMSTNEIRHSNRENEMVKRERVRGGRGGRAYLGWFGMILPGDSS
jgi:hypothetical protein